MSLVTTIKSYCEAYTNFTYNGTIYQLPYKLGSKKTPAEIASAISNWIGSSNKTTSQIQSYITNNPSSTGVDCSGLVYYVLNEASGGAVRTYFENKLGLTGQLSYSYGISASNLTSTAYGTKITAVKDLKPGCVIRTDNGGHVLVIYAVNRNSAGVVMSVEYAHSNSSKGPHKGRITITDQTKDLNHASQTWYDTAYTDAVAKSLYNYTLLLEPIA